MQYLGEFGPPARNYWRAGSLLDLVEARSQQEIDSTALVKDLPFSLITVPWVVHQPEPGRGDSITLGDNLRLATPQHTFWLPHYRVADDLFPPAHLPTQLYLAKTRSLQWSARALFLRSHTSDADLRYPFTLIWTSDLRLMESRNGSGLTQSLIEGAGIL